MLLLYSSVISRWSLPLIVRLMCNGNLNICKAGVLIHLIPWQIVFFVVVADVVKNAKMVDLKG